MSLSNADWPHWNLMPTAHAWELAFLSFGYEPRQSGLSELSIYESRQDYRKIKSRMDIILAHIQQNSLTTDDRTGDRRYSTVNIPIFINWATPLGWQLPKEFKGYEILVKNDLPVTAIETNLPICNAPIPKTIRVIEPLKIPEKITLAWIWSNADYKFWGVVLTAFCTAVAASWAAGFWVGQSVWINQLMERKAAPPITPAIAEKSTTPAISNDKMKIYSTIKK